MGQCTAFEAELLKEIDQKYKRNTKKKMRERMSNPKQKKT